MFAVAHCGCAKSSGAVIVAVSLCRGRAPARAGLEVSLALNGNAVACHLHGGVSVEWPRAAQQLNPAVSLLFLEGLEKAGMSCLTHLHEFHVPSGDCCAEKDQAILL